jgi:hypothetical protein
MAEKGMHVRAADARGEDANEVFAVARCRQRTVLICQLFDPGID